MYLLATHLFQQVMRRRSDARGSDSSDWTEQTLLYLPFDTLLECFERIWFRLRVRYCLSIYLMYIVSILLILTEKYFTNIDVYILA